MCRKVSRGVEWSGRRLEMEYDSKEGMFSFVRWNITCFFFSHRKVVKKLEDEWFCWEILHVNRTMKCPCCYFAVTSISLPFIRVLGRRGSESIKNVHSTVIGIRRHSHLPRLDFRSPFWIFAVQWNNAEDGDMLLSSRRKLSLLPNSSFFQCSAHFPCTRFCSFRWTSLYCKNET